MKNNKKRKNQISITEGDIKNKLYGVTEQKSPEQLSQSSKITEKEIMNKLYPAKEFQPNQKEPSSSQKEPLPSQKQKKVTEDLFEKKAIIQPGIQEELANLKLSISTLEQKLKASLEQKERLKIKLVQKRKLINIREKLADLILNRMPEKFILLLIVFLIFAIFMLVKSLRTTTVNVDNTAQTQEITVDTQPSKPEITPVVQKELPKQTAIVKKYTIQAAEYADEDAAQRFVNALKKQGFEVSIDTIYRDNNKTKAYFKINIGGFETFNQAKEFNEIFMQRTNIKDSFIKELKN